MSLCIEVGRTDVQRLMNISDVMGQENDGNRLRDLPLVLFGDSPLQHIDAERNHVHDIPFAPTCVSVTISLRRHHRDISVVKPVVRRRGRIGIVGWLVRAPEITQLFVNVAVSGIMKRSWIVDPFFVPALNFVCN